MERHLLVRMLMASLFCIGPCIAQAGINQWTIKGPPGGLYRDLEASSTDGNVFYTAYGRSFYRSTDGGVTWIEHPFTGFVNDIAVDPADGNRLLVAAQLDGLFRSLDGGQTFTKIAPDAQIWATAIGPNNVMYYSTSDEFRRSTDGGDSFGAPVPVIATIAQIVVSPTDANSVVARRGSLFLRSSDGGATWSQAPITTTGDGIFGLERLPNGNLVAALESGLYSSTDNGANWTQRLPGFTWSITIDRSAPNTLIAARSGPAVLVRSSDGGITWSFFGGPPLGDIRRAVLSRTSANRLLVANDRGLQRSTDGAATWSYVAGAPVASGLTSMATTVAPNSRVYAHTNAASLFSGANDPAWDRLDALDNESPAQGTLAVKPGAPLSVYLALFNQGVYRSVDGGRNWTRPNNRDLAGFAVDSIGFDPVDPSTLYAAVATGADTPPSSFYRSSDGGISWSPRSIDLPVVHAFRMAVDPANGARIFLAGFQGFFPAGAGGLYLSTNAGVNWNRIGFAGQDVNDVAIDPTDSNRVYAATAAGLQVSTNGGASFVRNDAHSNVTLQPARRIVIDPAIPTTIYSATLDVCCEPRSSFVLRSVDRGQTWETLRSGADAPTFLTGQLTLDPNVPSLIYADTGEHGIAAYEIVNDLAVTISGHSGLRPTGVPSTFQMRGEHLGALAATGVRLVATLPAGLTNVAATSDRGTCAVAGAVVTCSVPVLRPSQIVNAEVTYTPPSAMALDVLAAITAQERDTTTANSSAAASAVTGEVADLRVTVAASATSVTRGGNVTYTVQVANAGPIDSSSSVLTFAPGNGLTLGAAPSGCTAANGAMTCTLGVLANGATQSFQFTATAQGSGSLGATAAIAGATTAADPNGTNNTTTVTIASADPSSRGGGGGGGSLEWMTLLALSVFLRRTAAARRYS